MKRSLQEIIELIIFGLIALVLGTLLLWVGGWLVTFVGWVLRLVAGFIWSILWYILPVVIVAGVVYLLVQLVLKQISKDKAAQAATVTASGNPHGAHVDPEAAHEVAEDTLHAAGGDPAEPEGEDKKDA